MFVSISRPGLGPFQVWGRLPFDKLRANGQAFSFALSLSKGEFAPKTEMDPPDSGVSPIWGAAVNECLRQND
jgi:hypothetical protein